MRFIITTYNRPRSLLRLLIDLREEKAQDVLIYDDGSTEGYRAVVEFVAQQPAWRFVRCTHHGKHDFWRLVDRIYQDQAKSPADWYTFLPDDVRLCHRFLDRVYAVWKSIPNPKIALNLLRDNGREGRPSWTNVDPKPAGDTALYTGWIDGVFVAPRSYLESLAFHCPTVPDSWHSETKSSGVFAAISRQLVSRGLYQTVQSLIVHSQIASVMHPSVRPHEPLQTINFIDGSHAQACLEAPEDTVTISIATLPERANLLERVVATLTDQSDRLCVFLNGHTGVPAFLRHPKITTEVGDNRLGDAAKFWWAGKPGYYFTCDDDVIYPRDYVCRLVYRIETYQRCAVVGVLGRVLQEPLNNYYRNSLARYHTNAELSCDKMVHVLGTGCLAYHTSTLSVRVDDFPIPNMADIWFALAARRNNIPLISVRRQAGWLTCLPTPMGSIWDHYKERPEPTEAAQRGSPWPPTVPIDRNALLDARSESAPPLQGCQQEP